MRKFLLFAILLLSLRSTAQVSLGMGSFQGIPNDTVSAGSADTFSVYVRNLGPGIFNDVISIFSGVRDTANPAQIDTTSFTPGTFSAFLFPGDSILLTMTADYNVQPNSYRYGIDVIVIWPVANSASTADSTEYTVFITDPNGINELDVARLINIYPNPVSSDVNIDCGNKTVKAITIYDMKGSIVLSASRQRTIRIESLATGMYTVDVILSDEKHYSARIIKK